MNNYGENRALWDLLDKYKVVIPIVQRDYAQGRKDTANKEIANIRDNILEAILRALSEKSTLTLDYIYGSVVNTDRFLPIDGQQRLTTLYLLHWYFACKDNALNTEVKQRLSHFTYEVRDSATEFCESLSKNHIDVSSVDPDALSKAIQETPWYHKTFENDPTVSAMLNMLDCIHAKVHGEFHGVENGFELLTNAKLINFWQLTLENFGFTDDLFIKMNARGKKITKFENFKSSFESALDTQFSGDRKLVEVWKDRIDNDWTDFFWQYAENDHVNVEDYLFRFILFLFEMIVYKEDSKISLCDGDNGNSSFDTKSLDKVYYKGSIACVCKTEGALNFIEAALNCLDKIHGKDTFGKLFEVFEQYVKNGVIPYHQKAFIYANFAFLNSVGIDNPEEYNRFVRVIQNAINGYREINQQNKSYQSRIDRRYIGGFLIEIDKLVENIKSCGSVFAALANYTTDKAFFLHEVDKVRLFFASGIVDQPIHSDILDLESGSLNGWIDNFISSDKSCLLLSRTDFDELLECDKSLILRAIQGFSESLLLKPRYKGHWSWLEPESESGEQRLYHKYYFGMSDSTGFGEYIFTSDNDNQSVKSISLAVKAFIKSYSKELQNASATPTAILDRIIDKQMGVAIKPSSDSFYFVKYQEFFSAATNKHPYCVFLKESKFDIRALSGDNVRYTDNTGNFNPFYAALKNRLAMSKSTVTIVSDIVEKGAKISDKIELSNGALLKLLSNGKWYIDLNGGNISDDANAMIDCENNTVIESIPDCIELAVAFVSKM